MPLLSRTKLLDALKRISPALSNIGLIPVLTHFCFTGSRVIAFNDQIAMSVPLDLDIKAAVPGQLLLQILSVSRMGRLDLSLEKNELTIEAKKTSLRLPILPIEDFSKVFEMPKPKQADTIPAAKLFNSIKNCMRSVLDDTSVPDQMGITIKPNGSTLALYSYNDNTISKSSADIDKTFKFGKRVILSGKFCEQILANREPEATLEIHDDYALYRAGDLVIFGRLIEATSNIDIADVFDQHVTQGLIKSLVEIPKHLDRILDRAILITETLATDRTSMKITVENNSMRFLSKSKLGEVNDAVAANEHPDISVSLEPKLLKAGLDTFARWIIKDKCAIMAQSERYYLVSVSD